MSRNQRIQQIMNEIKEQHQGYSGKVLLHLALRQYTQEVRNLVSR